MPYRAWRWRDVKPSTPAIRDPSKESSAGARIPRQTIGEWTNRKSLIDTIHRQDVYRRLIVGSFSWLETPASCLLEDYLELELRVIPVLFAFRLSIRQSLPCIGLVPQRSPLLCCNWIDQSLRMRHDQILRKGLRRSYPPMRIELRPQTQLSPFQGIYVDCDNNSNKTQITVLVASKSRWVTRFQEPKACGAGSTEYRKDDLQHRDCSSSALYEQVLPVSR
ncbi:hypothetical protein J6590_013836 [Homalodisca vitripennis]|nr:hypothetical protein J6590_013836 [Homalodisca vitripennis]